MKILFVHEVSWHKKVSYEMHDFPELLSLRGHEVRFLDYDEGSPRTRFHTLTTVESRCHAGSRVSLTTPPKILPGILGRLLATVIHPIQFSLLVRQSRPDIVVLYSMPTSGWQIALIGRILGIPVVARVIDVPHALRRSSFRPLIRWSERIVFRNVSHVATHNRTLQAYCIENGADSARTSIIFPGVDTSRFFPDKTRTDLQVRLGINTSSKVIVFMGTLFRFCGLRELVTELVDSLHADKQLTLLIIGDGEQFSSLSKMIEKHRLQRQVILSGRVDYDELSDYLRLGDVAVLPFHRELVTECALPGKVLQYISCGVPTIATPLSGLVSALEDGHGVVYAGSMRDMVSLLSELLDDPTRRERISECGLLQVKEKFNWSNQIQEFENLLTRIIQEAS